MDVEAEILQLKLRTANLETSARCCDGDDPRRRCSHCMTLAGVYEELRGLRADLTLGIIQLSAEITEVRNDLSRGFAELNVAVTKVRNLLDESADDYECDCEYERDLARRFDSLRCDIIELGLRLDQLADIKKSTEPGG